MSNLFLMRMCLKFMEAKVSIERARGTRLGIAVDSDRDALEWQKWERLLSATLHEVERRLTA